MVLFPLTEDAVKPDQLEKSPNLRCDSENHANERQPVSFSKFAG